MLWIWTDPEPATCYGYERIRNLQHDMDMNGSGTCNMIWVWTDPEAATWYGSVQPLEPATWCGYELIRNLQHYMDMNGPGTCNMIYIRPDSNPSTQPNIKFCTPVSYCIISLLTSLMWQSNESFDLEILRFFHNLNLTGPLTIVTNAIKYFTEYSNSLARESDPRQSCFDGLFYSARESDPR